MERDMRINYGFQLSAERIDTFLLAVTSYYMGRNRTELIAMLLKLQYLTRDCQMYKDTNDEKFNETLNELNKATEEFKQFTRDHADDFMKAVVTSEVLFEETARKFMEIKS